MHIVNVMFGRGLGGIEQALVDYCEALKIEGHKVTAIISKKAKIKPALLPLGVNVIEVKTLGWWDFFAKSYINKVMAQVAPDAVITHGNRAAFLLKGNALNIPTIGVTHNYSIRHLIGLSAILATTEDLKNKVIEAGQPAIKVIKLPNMVRVSTSLTDAINNKEEFPKEFSSHKNPRQVRIGTMGRFVKKKGFEVFIRAISELKSQGIDFKAIIGGVGEEESELKALTTKLNLDSTLTFAGWIEDKEDFFKNIDIFVLPSLHEPFGIILLEAFAHKKAVVAADSEGPSEIIADGIDAILVPKGNSKEMAAAIAKIYNDKELAEKLIQNAFAKAMTYDIKHFAVSLSGALNVLLEK